MSMPADMQAATDERVYATLPAFIRAAYSEKEWMWLSDREKGRLIQNETEPEWTEP